MAFHTADVIGSPSASPRPLIAQSPTADGSPQASAETSRGQLCGVCRRHEVAPPRNGPTDFDERVVAPRMPWVLEDPPRDSSIARKWPGAVASARQSELLLATYAIDVCRAPWSALTIRPNGSTSVSSRCTLLLASGAASERDSSWDPATKRLACHADAPICTDGLRSGSCTTGSANRWDRTTRGTSSSYPGAPSQWCRARSSERSRTPRAPRACG
jgi:hypothetical protein